MRRFIANGALALVATFTAGLVGAAPFAYVPNFSNNNVSVLDLASETISGTLTVGLGPTGVVVLPDRSKVYVTNLNAGTVSVINTAGPSIAATVTVGSNPLVPSAKPDGTRVYVPNYGSNTVSVINTTNDTVVATLNTEAQPWGTAVSPDGARLYVTQFGANSIAVFNTATNTLVNTLTVGSGPVGVDFLPNGSKAYVVNRSSATVSVIDPATLQVTRTLNTGAAPAHVRISRSGNYAYVSNSGSGTISIIDTETDSIVGVFAVGGSPSGAAFTADGNKLLVANGNADSLSIVDVASRAVVNTITGVTLPYGYGDMIGAAGPYSPPALRIGFSASSSSLLSGQSVVLTATVTPYATGTILFKNSGVIVAQVPLSQGKASYTFTPPSAGRYILGAAFSGVNSSTAPRDIDVQFSGFAGSQEVVEYLLADADRYLYASRAEEKAALDAGQRGLWMRTGNVFRGFAASDAPAGALAVCRGYNASFASHMQSVSVAECQSGGYTLNNPSQFFVAAAQSGSCPSGLQAWYRHDNNRSDKNARYLSTATTPADMSARGWTAAGSSPAFCAALPSG